jgi:hypothetical protein
MELAAYLGTVAGMGTLGIGAMYAVAGTIGRRIDDLRTDIDVRFAQVDSRFAQIDARVDIRFSRVDSQLDAIIGAVSDLGQRVTRLETRGHD